MTIKTVYLFDPATGAFQHAYDAQESPLEPGQFIAPVHSTEAPPPPLSNGELAVWSGSQWLVVSPPPEDPEPTLTAAQIQAALDNAVTDWIDAQAQAAGFRNAAYIVSYYDSTNDTWRAAARAFVPWRDAIWAQCLAIMADVQSDNRPVPSKEALLAELTPFQA